MLSILLMLAAAADKPLPAHVHDGGVCVGLSWVKLLPREAASIEGGPDFDVYRFQGAKGERDWWDVYSGGYARAQGGGLVLLKRDGVTVRRATENGKFDGYLAERGGRQNHFFGTVFNDTSTDMHFFDRIDFGSSGQALCTKK